MELDEYYSQLMSYLGSLDEEPANAFLDYFSQVIEEMGIVDDFNPVHYVNLRSTRKPMAVSAWSFHQGSATLHLFINHFEDAAEPFTITKQNFKTIFNKVENYFATALSDAYFEHFPARTPEGDLADKLQKLWGGKSLGSSEAERIVFHLVSNGRLKTQESQLLDGDIRGIQVGYEIWDIERLKRVEEAGQGRTDIFVDFSSDYPDGLPALPASNQEQGLEAFLFVLPGSILANIYSKFGDRLLEQNVRTFLQFRGAVNRGLRNTIQNEPHLFFSFNNGLTATAEKVDFDRKSGRLRSVTNLQIVNGGQTTAAIFAARLLKVDISKVFVQVKLSIVEPDQTDVLVPRISAYANTQNKVSVADLSANHPFQRRMEEHSRRIGWQQPGSLKGETYWFYERTRGQYLNAQLKLTPTQKRSFGTVNPRNQVITKTDLAKYELAFSDKPYVVALGAQKCFVRFVEEIAKRWKDEGLEFNELYFKQAIGRAIIFRSLDKKIYKEPWYNGYKAQIVAYTLAVFSKAVKATGKEFNFELIWKDQAVPEAVLDYLISIAADVNEMIKQGQDVTTNIGEYCKRPTCWDRIQVLSEKHTVDRSMAKLLVSNEDLKVERRKAKDDQVIINEITCVMDVHNKGVGYWLEFESWAHENKCLSPMELTALHQAACGRVLQERQAKALLKALNRAIVLGYANRKS